MIYLRPFITAGVHTLGVGVTKALQRALFSSPEEKLLNRLWRFGHVTTIARPGEQLPYPGAIHVHIPENEWRDKVKEYIRRAGIIAIRISDSKNLMWEIRIAAEIKERSALLLWFPPYDTWGALIESVEWSTVKPELELSLRVQIPDNVSRGSYLYFDPEGNIVVSSRVNAFIAQHKTKVRRISFLEVVRLIQILSTVGGLAIGWFYGVTWFHVWFGNRNSPADAGGFLYSGSSQSVRC